MAKLKAGTAKTPEGFANSLAAAIEDAMKQEWLAVKGEVMPSAPDGGQDRQMLFAAIAQGVLKYLYEHRSDIETNSFGSGSYRHDHHLDFLWEIKRPGE